MSLIAMDAIRVDGLVKSFNGFTAVDHISFAVPEGELFGLLGPNGAGKTTTINMLATLLRPTAGTAAVAGFDVARDRDDVRKSIGIVFQEPALDGRLTGRENLEFHTMMYGLAKAERRRRIDEVLALVELSDKAGTLVEKYSGGMTRRLEIAPRCCSSTSPHSGSTPRPGATSGTTSESSIKSRA
jgi:ABC-2 type transport system ATP-binding protein